MMQFSLPTKIRFFLPINAFYAQAPPPPFVAQTPSFFAHKSYPRAFFMPKRLQLLGHIPDVPSTPARPVPCHAPARPDQARAPLILCTDPPHSLPRVGPRPPPSLPRPPSSLDSLLHGGNEMTRCTAARRERRSPRNGRTPMSDLIRCSWPFSETLKSLFPLGNKRPISKSLLSKQS